jgi:hypothetical protein
MSNTRLVFGDAITDFISAHAGNECILNRKYGGYIKTFCLQPDIERVSVFSMVKQLHLMLPQRL